MAFSRREAEQGLTVFGDTVILTLLSPVGTQALDSIL